VLAAGCRDAASPEGRGPVAPEFASAGSGIALDQSSGSLGSGPTTLLGKGFNPTNPHLGDAIVATFFWVGPSNVITRVYDRLANGTPVGNRYTFVDSVSAGGISMATYVATNVQNFPDPNSTQSDVLVVLADLSAQVPDGGTMISAYSGVAVGAQAVGAHGSASGTGSSATAASPGSFAVGAGGLAYGVTMANGVVGVTPPPPPFTTILTMSAASMKTDGEYAVLTSGGAVNPQWTWHFTAPSTWLATGLALNPAAAPPPPAPATHVTFTVQPSTTTAGSTISPPVQVAAQDDAGNTDASFTGSITLALGTNPGGGTLSGTKSVTAVNGVATFSNLSIDKAGNGYTLQATASGLTGASSAAFNITAPAPPPAPPPSGSGITLDVKNGSFGSGPTTLLGKGFNPTNPHLGDAIVATFFWVGPSNVITRVYDRLTNGTPVGNTYTFVDSVSTGGISMATYVATNVQNFPDPNRDQDDILVVLADLSTQVSDGGSMISAYSGVAAVTADALGDHHSAFGSGSAQTVAAPGAIDVGAGALAYGVTMSDGPVGIEPRPAGFTLIFPLSDNFIAADGEYAVLASGGAVNPQWTWHFENSPPVPRTWLATVLALNAAGAPPANQPPVASFTSSCTGLACTFTNTSTDPDGSITSYSWDFGDGATSNLQSLSHTYGAEGSYTVTLTVTDDQGATSSSSQDVTVTAPNQPPTVNAGPNETALLGLFYTETATFSDPDNDGPWSYTIDWGDGSSPTTGSTSSQGTISATHTYVLPLGTHTIRVTVTDSHGASGSDTKVVTVIL